VHVLVFPTIITFLIFTVVTQGLKERSTCCTNAGTCSIFLKTHVSVQSAGCS